MTHFVKRKPGSTYVPGTISWGPTIYALKSMSGLNTGVGAGVGVIFQLGS